MTCLIIPLSARKSSMRLKRLQTRDEGGGGRIVARRRDKTRRRGRKFDGSFEHESSTLYDVENRFKLKLYSLGKRTAIDYFNNTHGMRRRRCFRRVARASFVIYISARSLHVRASTLTGFIASFIYRGQTRPSLQRSYAGQIYLYSYLRSKLSER